MVGVGLPSLLPLDTRGSVVIVLLTPKHLLWHMKYRIRTGPSPRSPSTESKGRGLGVDKPVPKLKVGLRGGCPDRETLQVDSLVRAAQDVGPVWGSDRGRKRRRGTGSRGLLIFFLSDLR